MRSKENEKHVLSKLEVAVVDGHGAFNGRQEACDAKDA